MLTEINQLENVVFILNKLLVEVSVIDSYDVQIISDDVGYIQISEEWTDELTIRLKSNRSLIPKK